MRFLVTWCRSLALVCVPRLPPVSLNRYKSWLGFVMACVRMDHTTTVWDSGLLEVWNACMHVYGTVYRTSCTVPCRMSVPAW